MTGEPMWQARITPTRFGYRASFTHTVPGLPWAQMELVALEPFAWSKAGIRRKAARKLVKLRAEETRAAHVETL